MANLRPKSSREKRCEEHDKVCYRSVQHAVGGAVFIAEMKGTARIYWAPDCGNYHITSKAPKLHPKGE